MSHKNDDLVLKTTQDRAKLNIITIDPPNAKDLDDGFAIRNITQKGFVIDICIADVSAHVAKDSQLDRDAYRKGFTRYGNEGATDPMFPRYLSEGTLSLLPRQERLTLTVSFKIHGDTISEPEFSQTTSFNQFQFTYAQADKVLAGKNIDNPDKINFVPIFKCLEHAAELFLEERRRRGSKVFYNADDLSSYTNDDGISVTTPENQRSRSHILVAECMIKANLAFAKLIKSQLPFGFFRVTGKESAEDTVETTKISGASAHYSPDPKPHNNMGTEYTNGTSPIRRYADLIVHRIIIALIKKQKQLYTKQELKAAAKHLNAIEKTLSSGEFLLF